MGKKYSFMCLDYLIISLLSSRTLKTVWAARVSPNVLYSMHHLQSDTTTLVTGGIDGVLRLVDQATGQVLSCCIMGERSTKPNGSYGSTEKRSGRRIDEDVRIDLMPNANRPSINCAWLLE